MARKPNYSFQKMQKEAAKQKRRAEKRERKRQKREEQTGDAVTDQDSPPAEPPA